MTITDIYSTYTIPPNLIRHQLEVTAVGQYVCDHWIGPKINKELVTETLLLHDMGNIIKFKRPFLGELEKDAAYWEKIQAHFIQKYGTDVHIATMMIVAELGKEETVGQILQEMKQLGETLGENASWEARIGAYADCCVTPSGIVGFEVRLADLIRRYHHKDDQRWVKSIRENAKKIQGNVDVDLSTLPSFQIAPATRPVDK